MKAAARAACEVPDLNGFWVDDHFLPAPSVQLVAAIVAALVAVVGVLIARDRMPLTLADRTGSRIATAVINLAIGVAVATIVDSVARTTQRPGPPQSLGGRVPTRRRRRTAGTPGRFRPPPLSTVRDSPAAAHRRRRGTGPSV